MRHFIEGAAQYASEIAPIPIINAGDGAHQHPSQCMLDLYTIYQTQGTLDNLNIFLVGDLKYGRTVHSLIMAMRHFNPTFHFVAPKELAMPNEYKLYCKEHGIKYMEHTAFNEKIIADADIIYMTRVQKERFSDLMEYERVKNVYILKADMLKGVKSNMKILHPLPRVNEIAYDVDETPYAYYIQQAQNGLYAREAIICDVLGITLEDVRAAFHDTVTEYKHYQDVVAQILEGPSKGRSRRKVYKTKDGGEGDIYDIFLLGISDDPPMLKFSLEEIQRRIKKIIAEDESMPAPLNLSKTAKNVEKIVKEAMPNADTLDWKDGELYILDPFLLFYLRWSRAWKSGLIS